MDLPHIVALARKGAELDPLQATAGKLWLAGTGAALDEGGQLRRAVDAFWRCQPGADPYWAFMATRMDCDGCGEIFKVENLAICPNCFRTWCYRHDRTCRCGHTTVG